MRAFLVNLLGEHTTPAPSGGRGNAGRAKTLSNQSAESASDLDRVSPHTLRQGHKRLAPAAQLSQKSRKYTAGG